MKTIIGIDNGISGGLAEISILSGTLLRIFPMPIQQARKGNEIQIEDVWNWIVKDGSSSLDLIICVEEPGGSKSASAAASMAGSFHAIRAMAVLKHVRLHRITPQSWQKKLIPGAAGDTKPRALSKARELWPNESFLASPRCKKPHDGMIDAALIAEYCRLHLI